MHFKIGKLHFLVPVWSTRNSQKRNYHDFFFFLRQIKNSPHPYLEYVPAVLFGANNRPLISLVPEPIQPDKRLRFPHVALWPQNRSFTTGDPVTHCQLAEALWCNWGVVIAKVLVNTWEWPPNRDNLISTHCWEKGRRGIERAWVRPGVLILASFLSARPSQESQLVLPLFACGDIRAKV